MRCFFRLSLVAVGIVGLMAVGNFVLGQEIAPRPVEQVIQQAAPVCVGTPLNVPVPVRVHVIPQVSVTQSAGCIGTRSTVQQSTGCIGTHTFSIPVPIHVNIVPQVSTAVQSANVCPQQTQVRDMPRTIIQQIPQTIVQQAPILTQSAPLTLAPVCPSCDNGRRSPTLSLNLGGRGILSHLLGSHHRRVTRDRGRDRDGGNNGVICDGQGQCDYGD
jgi:hypothetical protein